MPKLVNLTPHALHFFPTDYPDTFPVTSGPYSENTAVIMASEGTARCQQEDYPTGERFIIADDSLVAVLEYKTVFGELVGLPEPQPDTLYIVSAIAHSAAKAAGRTDTRIVVRTVRDGAGKIVGCRGIGI